MPRITITEPGKNPQPYRFDLDTDSVKIGRAAENEIVLECGSISSSHAEMTRVPGGFELRDLGSTNGITRGDERLDAVLLADGDQLMLGDVEFDFQLNEAEIAALAAGSEETTEVEDLVKEMPARPPLPKLTRKENASRDPADRPGPVRREVARAGGEGDASGWWLVLAFLVLGSAAFFIGASMRHKNEIGVSLGEIIKKRLSTPDVAGATERIARQSGEVFVEPPEEESLVIAPVEVEEVPVEIEGWEVRDRPEGGEDDPERRDEEIETVLEPENGESPETTGGDGPTSDEDEEEVPVENGNGVGNEVGEGDQDDEQAEREPLDDEE